MGEPSCPVSTGVRGHNRSLVNVDGPQLQALDHDFHLHGIVPSVAFVIDLPDQESDSFFRGHVFVTNKDKVTQPSSALRHAAELTDLIATHFGADGHISAKPIAIVVSDGGPDHRVTFGSVKVSSLTLFRTLNLDMLICVRTCPYQSWQNLAEPIMSTLNLALQNVSLARTSMTHQCEQPVKNCNSLSDIRKMIQKHPDLCGALRDSMSAPLINVGTRFGSMKVKENPVRLGVPASESNMNDQFQHARFIDPSLEPENLTAKDLAKATSLMNFIKTHCHSSNYVFQIRKCKYLACYYCMQHPIHLPDVVFNSLSFLPLHLLDTSKEHFLKFTHVYGQLPSGRDRPSLIPVALEEAKEIDKERKSALVRGKVRATIACGECSEPRCIYSPSKLSPKSVERN